jgi:hypothetical protein
MLTSFERGLVAHLIGDWIFQNDWIARNKMSLRHPAAWVHAGIQFVLLTIALDWVSGLVLATIHLLVDTRIPQRWWSRVFRQTREGEMGMHVLIWGDQVLHITALGLWLVFRPYLGI